MPDPLHQHSIWIFIVSVHFATTPTTCLVSTQRLYVMLVGDIVIRKELKKDNKMIFRKLISLIKIVHMDIPDKYTHVSGFNSQPDLSLQPRIGEVAIFMLLHWSLKKAIFENLIYTLT